MRFPTIASENDQLLNRWIFRRTSQNSCQWQTRQTNALNFIFLRKDLHLQVIIPRNENLKYSICQSWSLFLWSPMLYRKSDPLIPRVPRTYGPQCPLETWAATQNNSPFHLPRPVSSAGSCLKKEKYSEEAVRKNGLVGLTICRSRVQAVWRQRGRVSAHQSESQSSGLWFESSSDYY